MNLLTPSGGLLFWMVLIFTIVFIILAKWGFPAISSAVRERSKHIAESLEQARKAREQIEGAQAVCDQMMAKTRAEQAEILQKASRASEQIVEQARKQATEKAALIVASAERDIERMRHEALDALRNEVVTLSVAVSEKILKQSLEPDGEQRSLILRTLDEMREREQENERRNNS